MAIKLTADSFAGVVRKSGLIPADRLQRLFEEFKERDLDVDNSAVLAEALVDEGALTRWQAEKLLQGKSRGYFLGKYRLLALLGKGGMSSVYLAEHVLMRRRCAIKVLPARRVGDSSYLGRFHREAQAVASLDHPNIVRAYDVDHQTDRDQEIHFLVMEYVEGRSLQEMIQERGPLDPAQAADFIRQAAEGLAHAHQAGMVHRDVKPGNLLVDARGTVKILDLGLARFFADTDDQSLTVAHEEKVLGTADYLAPEQALDSHKADARADIYSLGCTFYFLVTGHPPFTEGTLAQRLMAHQTQEPAPLEKESPGTPGELIAVIRKMTAKEADGRYQTAREVADVLAAWIAEHAPAEWTRQRAEGKFEDRGSKIEDRDPRFSIRDPLATQSGSPPTAQPVADAGGVGKDSGSDLHGTAAGRYPGGLAPSNARPETAVPLARPVIPGSAPSAGAGSDSKTPVVAHPVKRHAGSAAKPQAEAIGGTAVVDPQSATTERNGTGGVGRRLRSNKRLAAAIAAAAGIVLIAVVAIVVSLSGNDGGAERGGGGKTTQTGGGGGGTSPRELTVGPDSEFQTIGAALSRVLEARRNARPQSSADWFVINVSGGRTYHEAVVIDNSDQRLEEIQLRLVSTGPEPAVLAPGDSESVVKLHHAKHVTLEGFHVKAEGGPVGVSLRGFCTGLKLSNLRITAFGEAGIVGTDLQGFFGAAGEEVYLNGLHLEASKPAAVAMRFVTDRDRTTRVNISRSRFSGPMAAAIEFRGEAAYSSVENNVFSQTGSGVLFRGKPDLVEVSIRHNTFHRLQAGIVFEQMPDGSSRDLEIARNLFVECEGPDAVVKKGYDADGFQRLLGDARRGIRENMTTRTEPPAGEMEFLFGHGGKRGIKVGFESTVPGEKGFLLPLPGAEHAEIGAQPR